MELNKKYLERIAMASSILTGGTVIIATITLLAVSLKNNNGVFSIARSELPYSERVVEDSLATSRKTTREEFRGNGFTPEEPTGDEANIPPGYKDRDFQKAESDKSDFGLIHQSGKALFVQYQNSQKAGQPRKMVYSGTASLEVSSVKESIQTMKQAIEKDGGYVETETMQRDAHDRLHAELVIRLKPEVYSAFLKLIESFGKVLSINNTVSDISAEYVDVQIRLENKLKTRDQILNILNRKTGNLKDIIEGTKELANITEAIERLKGNVKHYDQQVSMTTITISLAEPLALRPDRSESIFRKMGGSFVGAFYLFIDFVAAVIQSTGVLLPLGLIGFFGWKYYRKKKRSVVLPEVSKKRKA